MERIEGIVEDIIYRNEDNGYSVITVSTEEGEMTVVGSMFGLSAGELISAEGEFISHPIYGRQLQVAHIETGIPTERSAMERYLGSGAIKGIGPAMAGKIVARFDTQTFYIIEAEPERLAEVKGISPRMAQDIATRFHEQRAMRQGVIFLQEYGLSLTYALKIYNHYKDKTFQIVKHNPYRLAEDIQGISFKIADGIAERLGCDPASEQRIMAGIVHVLKKSAAEGHTYMPREELLARSHGLLALPVLELENALLELQLQGSIHVDRSHGEERVYLMAYHQMEQQVSAKLFELDRAGEGHPPVDEATIAKLEKKTGIAFDENQVRAIDEAMQSGVLIITGGPGTGKTTTINAIIELLEEDDRTVLLAAPTGRAAKRMKETTGREAKTIHRLLEISFTKDAASQRFERNEDFPLEADAVIIDETSMLDIVLLHHLLKAVAPGTQLIFVGDKDQLPSVGPGNVLKDMIHSGSIRTVKLQTIFRQAQESDIIVNAHKINTGEHFDLASNKKDFFFIGRSRPEDILEEILTLVATRLPRFAKIDARDGIQVLTPTRKGLLGVDSLNSLLQKKLNPADDRKVEKLYRDRVFREGDKVMQIRNNYNLPWKIVSRHKFTIDEGLGVFNGDMGRVVEINKYNEKVTVLFDDEKTVEYGFDSLDELELAYAITIHKSQGSEYPVVVMPLFKGPSMLLTRNLLYTGVTRAKRYAVLVGAEETVRQMASNAREVDRRSSLHEKIGDIYAIQG